MVHPGAQQPPKPVDWDAISSIGTRRRHPDVIDGRSPAQTSSATSSAPLPKLLKLSWITRSELSRKDQRKQPSAYKRLPNAAATASYAANDGKPGKADETSSPYRLPHAHQQEATSTIQQPPCCPRVTSRQPPLNDFKLSPACTKYACVAWHPAPSPPQHRDALTCPIPDTPSTNEPNIVARATQYMLVTGCRVELQRMF